MSKTANATDSDRDDADALTLTPQLEAFVTNVNSLHSTAPMVMFFVNTATRVQLEELDDFAEEFGEETEDKDGSKSFTFQANHVAQFLALRDQVDEARRALELVPRTFLVSLVSQFDSLVGNVLRVVYLKRPEMLAASDRQLSLSQLLDLGSVEKASEYLVEKEIEQLLRSSHAEQFNWMENQFSVELRKDLPSWPVFVELTERRNLFVHTDGIVSEQYLGVCSKHGVSDLDALERGMELEVEPEYFSSVCDCVFELGVKLAHVLWRKLIPDELGESDSSLIEIGLELLKRKRWALAQNLLSFACYVLPRHSSDVTRRTLVINLAQAYKWNGEAEQCQAVLDKEDWSASDEKFRLAVSVLEDRHEEASVLMKSIGANGRSIREHDYHSWPLFREFRSTDAFMSTYEALYGAPFQHTEKIYEDRRKAKREELRQKLKSPEEAEEEEE